MIRCRYCGSYGESDAERDEALRMEGERRLQARIDADGREESPTPTDDDYLAFVGSHVRYMLSRTST